MAELTSLTVAGAAVGDTFGTRQVVRVVADTKYVFNSAKLDLADTVANKAARPPVATKADGYRVNVTTNGLTYMVDNGAYVVEEYEIPVATLAARDALTEQETGQRVYIDALDRTDRWDGTKWVEGSVIEGLYAVVADLPDPTTFKVGTKGRVTNDPNPALNGTYIVLGANPNSNGTYWDKD